ncbi:unnamed protein product [Diatraea saccharalis]|uniref:PHD-type domain-containing protein n=1 Tax=Diatraea saccharalis TaxID=40085 RepID=A0A9N9QU44_9NEOP|nr:unnamed protein product [Diatraea saccharalis]
MSPRQKCAGCTNTLPKRDYIQCVSCKSMYDLDCANVSKKLFELMERKDNWKCPLCVSKRPKTGNTNTPIRTATSEIETEQHSHLAARDNEGDQNVTIRNKTSRSTIAEKRQTVLTVQKPSHNSLITTEEKHNSPSTVTECSRSSVDSAIVTELKLYMGELFHAQTNSLREMITNLTETIKAQAIRIEKLEAKVLELEERKGMDVLDNKLKQLQLEIYDRDQTLLANDIEITGCPEMGNENCIALVRSIATKIGINIEEKDVVSARRVGPARPQAEISPSTRPRPIAIRLVCNATKDILLRAARVRRTLTTDGLQLPGPAKAIYINERLTGYNRMLFQKARALAQVNEISEKKLGRPSGEIQGVNPKIDSVAFRLHCGATTAALLAASAALTTRHLVGNPIDCIHTRDIPEDVLNTYCWIHSTFTVAGEAGAYPGVRGAGNSPRRYGKYYQWVAFTLFFQVSG